MATFALLLLPDPTPPRLSPVPHTASRPTSYQSTVLSAKPFPQGPIPPPSYLITLSLLVSTTATHSSPGPSATPLAYHSPSTSTSVRPVEGV